MGEPVRVLHVVVNMNRGGAETLLMNLYRNLNRSKVQFDFLTCKEGSFDAEIIKLGGRIHRIPYMTETGHFQYIKALDQFFAEHREYGIVHAHMDKMSGFVLRSAQKAGVPVRIAHSHSVRSEGGVAARVYKWFAGQWIVPNATHFMACSKDAAKWLFGEEARGVILKNGIDANRYRYSADIREQVRQELHLSPDTFAIGHVGRFSRVKNHAYLIEVFAELAKEKPDAVLLLAGDGALRPEMEKKAIELKLEDRISFLGVRSDIDRLLQAFDLFAFPSRHEGLPVTLIEAQGAGLPCLISDAITTDVNMGISPIDYLPLNDKRIWVEKMKERIEKQAPRLVQLDAIGWKGYDIRNTAAWTEGFYLAIER